MDDVEIDESDRPFPLGVWKCRSYTALVVGGDWHAVQFIPFEPPIKIREERLESFVYEWEPRLDIPVAPVARAFLDSGLARYGGITNGARAALRDLAGRTPAEIAEEML